MRAILEIEKYSLIMTSIEKDNDIVLIETGETHEVDLTMAKEIVAHRLDFMKDRKHYLILDLSNVKMVSRDAKEFLQQEEGGLKNIIGAAFIACNPIASMIANIFVKTPTHFETKFFSTKASAINWILEYKKKNNRLSNI